MQMIRTQPRRSHSWKLAGAGASVAILTFAAAAALWPRPSLAAELKQIQLADAGAQSVIERCWNAGPDGKLELVDEVVRLNGATKATTKGASTQYFDGKRVTNDFGGYATIEDKPAHMESTAAKSLDQLLNLDGIRKWTVEKNVRTELGLADRYKIEWAAAGRAGTIELLADPRTHRPLRQTGIAGNAIGFKYEWHYRPVSAADVAFKPTPGQRVYDIDAQRREFLGMLNAAKGSAETPDIVAAYVDENGLAVVFTVGDDGFADESRPAVSIAGDRGEPASFPWNRADASRQYGALYRGKTITAHTLKLTRIPPQRGVVEVQVEGKTLSGVVPIRRTASLNSLFAPLNVPFFEEGTTEGQVTNAG